MEIEIKLRVKNVQELRKKLQEKGAVKDTKITNIDKYYSAKHRDFMKTKECLRVRSIPEKNKFILTYKPQSTSKMIENNFFWKDELEVEIADDNVIDKIFSALDFKELVTVHKIREQYKFNEFNIEIDEVRDIGYFMEIERFGDDPTVVEKEMWDMLEDLGFSKNDVEKMNYRDLVMNYLKSVA